MIISKRIYLLPAIIVMGVLFLISHTPEPPIPEFNFQWSDKMLHAIAYFALGTTLIFAFCSNYSYWSKRKILIYVLCIGFLYGIFDELHQYFIPGRDACIYDWFSDCIGISLSLFLLPFFNRIFSKIKIK